VQPSGNSPSAAGNAKAGIYRKIGYNIIIIVYFFKNTPPEGAGVPLYFARPESPSIT